MSSILQSRPCLVKIFLVLFKFIFALLLIYWLVYSKQLDLQSITSIKLTGQNSLLLASGVIAILLALAAMALRIKMLLNFFDIKISFKRASVVTAIGAFTGVFLPGVVGGDAVKSVYLCYTEARNKQSEAVGVIVADRIIGIFSLLLLGSLVVAAGGALNHLPFRSWILLAAPIGVGVHLVVTLIFSSDFLSQISMLRWFKNKMPSSIRDFISALRNLARRPDVLLECIILSLITHALTCLTFLFAAAIMGISIPWINQFLLSPLAMTMNAIPLTPGGIGISEGVFSYLYRLSGFEQGANIGLLGRGIQYIGFLIAGIIAFAATPGVKWRQKKYDLDFRRQQ